MQAQDVLFGVVIVMAVVNALLAAAMAQFFQARAGETAGRRAGGRRRIGGEDDPEMGNGGRVDADEQENDCTKFVF